MDLNQYNVERAGYNVLDLLSNVGGIQAMLVSSLSAIISIFNYKNFDNILVA